MITISDLLDTAYQWKDQAQMTLQNKIPNQIEKVKCFVIHKRLLIIQSSCDAAHWMCQKLYLTVNKIITMMDNNKKEFFLIGCCCTTAYFSPFIFFSSTIITIIIRVELENHLKKLADYYLKDEHNPYKLNPKYSSCVSYVDLTLGTIAAADTIALNTIFKACKTSLTTHFLLPALGGLTAGNFIAKKVMNSDN